jgi:hypothetical protein
VAPTDPHRAETRTATVVEPRHPWRRRSQAGERPGPPVRRHDGVNVEAAPLQLAPRSKFSGGRIFYRGCPHLPDAAAQLRHTLQIVRPEHFAPSRLLLERPVLRRFTRAIPSAGDLRRIIASRWPSGARGAEDRPLLR